MNKNITHSIQKYNLFFKQHNHTINYSTQRINHSTQRMFEGPFETTLKRRKTRQRFYSSMNYDEYFLLYGPPAPVTKPLEDPTQDIPPLELELELEQRNGEQQRQLQKLPTFELAPFKLETIFEIDGSQNLTHTLFKSPRMDFTERKALKQIEQQYTPKRMRVRNRSQSDNSEYLIFNFLERANQNGRKKSKLD